MRSPAEVTGTGPPGAAPLRPGSSAGYQVNRLARLYEAALRQRIARYGVVPGQFPALLALYERDGQTQRELCEIASVDQSTMAKTLARMERDRLVTSAPDPEDARRVRYYLTGTARGLEAKLSEAGHEVLAAAAAGIPADQIEVFNQVLAAMAGNLGGH
ncbi:MAG TPA: MarR family winged helix-turn-helix transcriptional regulator [Streptosporangiaceae bacterium]|nr:MarR family winged helix-turn-helix transcriptional regulator [Streptosporangiaceae bacterium]